MTYLDMVNPFILQLWIWHNFISIIFLFGRDIDAIILLALLV